MPSRKHPQRHPETEWDRVPRVLLLWIIPKSVKLFSIIVAAFYWVWNFSAFKQLAVSISECDTETHKSLSDFSQCCKNMVNSAFWVFLEPVLFSFSFICIAFISEVWGVWTCGNYCKVPIKLPIRPCSGCHCNKPVLNRSLLVFCKFL